MSDWGYWDWLAYATITLAAVVEALEAALQRADELRARLPKIFSNRNISFIPLVLVSIGSVVFIAKIVGWIQTNHETVFSYNSDRKDFIEVKDQNFEEQEVLLDRHSFTNCRFMNVTFVYNGTGPVQFSHNYVYGRSRILTSNPSVFGSMAVLRGLGVLNPSLQFAAPAGVVIEPPIVMNNKSPSAP